MVENQEIQQIEPIPASETTIVDENSFATTFPVVTTIVKSQQHIYDSVQKFPEHVRVEIIA